MDMRSYFGTVSDLLLDEDDLRILDHNHLEAEDTDYILEEQICCCTVAVADTDVVVAAAAAGVATSFAAVVFVAAEQRTFVAASSVAGKSVVAAVGDTAGVAVAEEDWSKAEEHWSCSCCYCSDSTCCCCYCCIRSCIQLCCNQLQLGWTCWWADGRSCCRRSCSVWLMQMRKIWKKLINEAVEQFAEQTDTDAAVVAAVVCYSRCCCCS